MAEFCMETTTPDWVFGLFLSAGLVGLTAALAWGSLFLIRGPVQSPGSLHPRRQWPSLLLTGVWVAYVTVDAFRAPNWAEFWMRAGPLLLGAYAMTGLALHARRLVRTGGGPRFSPLRAPLGVFWTLPVIFLAASGAAVWAAQAMSNSLQPC